VRLRGIRFCKAVKMWYNRAWILSFWTVHTNMGYQQNNMNYDEIDVDKIVNEVSTAVAQGNYRKATKKESMEVRLAALALLVKNMQGEMHDIVQNEKELAHA